jgi:hypothetical protein
MKTYGEWYNFWKRFDQNTLVEIRNIIVDEGKSELNSLRLEVIDDLLYLKDNNLPL